MAGMPNCAHAPASSSGTAAPSRKLNPERAWSSTYLANFAIYSPDSIFAGPAAECQDGLMDLWELADLSTPWSLHIVATLRIADRIQAGVTGIAQLAAESSADASALHRVLRHL